MSKKKWIVIGIILMVAILGVGGAITYKLNQKEDPEPYIDPTIEPNPYNGYTFNTRLIKEVNKSQNNNYLISPYSIEIALSMLREGANGKTKEEIDSLIGNREIADVSVKDKIGIANAIFMRDQYEPFIKKPFVNTIKDTYHGEVMVDPFATPDKINNWVKDHTNGMIEKILDEVDPDFVLGLANALAIDVEWNYGFECINTREEEFTKANNEKINVEMMHNTYKNDAKYFETDHSKGVIIPYKKYEEEGKEKQLEFVAILPNEDVNTFIEVLTDEELEQINKNAFEATSKKDIVLSLPRVRYDFDLKNFLIVLKELGMDTAFSKEAADFTNIMNREDLVQFGATNLYVGQAIHKTAIDLNEKGTKAAAITYFAIMKSNAMIAADETEHLVITFNKPYVYMIQDHESGEVLFFGVVQEPNKWQGTTCEEEEDY